MKLSDLEDATVEDLRKRVDDLFEEADNAQFIPQRETRLSDARFYLQEIERRDHERIARRDYRMELVVILLIGLELVVAVVLAIIGARQQTRDVNQQLTAFGNMQTVLSHLQESSAATAQTLRSLQSTMQTMNDRLGSELGRMSQFAVDFYFQRTEKTLDLFNNGNVDLELWGYKINGREMINDKAAVLKRSAHWKASPAVFGALTNAMDKGNGSTTLSLLLRDDFGNQFVGETTIFGGSNLEGTSGIFTIVQKRWSAK